MMNFQFKKLLKENADKFLIELEKTDLVRVFSHHDADGLCSAALISEFLRFKDKKFHLTILPQLEKRNINQLKSTGLVILCDFGSGQLSDLKELIDSNKVLILDHHQINSERMVNNNLLHVNPHLAGVDGSLEVSAAGVVYLFLKHAGYTANALLALIGASGDYQDIDGFKGLNQEIINECPKLVERKDLRIYGANTRPIHKALEYANIIIPGISGSGSGCVNFLNDLGISLKNGDEWRTLNDLTSDEKKKLISSIIVKRSSEDKPDDIFNTVYEIAEEQGFRRNLKEFSSMLNACGRLEKPSIGLVVLTNKEHDNLALEVSSEYKNIITQSLNWFENNKDKFIETNRVFYLTAGDGIKPSVIGTICSIVSASKLINKELIIGLAVDNESIKISARKSMNSEVNIGKALNKATNGIGEGGGHNDAGGAYIKKGLEKEFINAFEKVLKE